MNMKKDHTSNQRRRITAGPFRRRMTMAMRPSGRMAQKRKSTQGRAFLVSGKVNQTKLAILVVMQELNRPIVASELYDILGWCRGQPVLDYHLCTLVAVGSVEPIFEGQEVHFRATGGSL